MRQLASAGYPVSDGDRRRRRSWGLKRPLSRPMRLVGIAAYRSCRLEHAALVTRSRRRHDEGALSLQPWRRSLRCPGLVPIHASQPAEQGASHERVPQLCCGMTRNRFDALNPLMSSTTQDNSHILNLQKTRASICGRWRSRARSRGPTETSGQNGFPPCHRYCNTERAALDRGERRHQPVNATRSDPTTNPTRPDPTRPDPTRPEDQR